MRKTHWMLSLLMLAVAAPLFAADTGWRVDKDKDGIQIESRAVAGWDIREMRGTARHQGRLSSLVAVLTDVNAAPELNDLVVKSTVEQRDSETRYRFYTLIKMPWPLTNRDVLMQREVVQDPSTRVVTITDVALEGGMPEKKDMVRIIKSRQQWTLKPAADGSVAIELRLLSDPRGPIPASVVNTLSVSTPFKTIDRLKALAKTPKYAQARLAYVKDAGAN